MTRRSIASDVTGMRSRATIATFLAALAIALLAVLTLAGPTLADPPDTLINPPNHRHRSEEHTSELQSLMRISYAVFCLKKKTQHCKINHSYRTVPHKTKSST